MPFDLSTAKDYTPSKSSFDLSTAKPVHPVTPSEEPGWFEPGSRSEALTRGFANAATLGMAPRISDIANKIGIGGSKLTDYLAADQAAQEAHPGYAAAGSVAGALPSAFATGGGGIIRQAATGAGLSGLNTFGNTEDPSLTNIAGSAAVGGVLGSAPTALYKGAVNAADSITKKSVTDNIDSIIKNKAPGWKDELAKIMRGKDKDFIQDSVSSVEEAKVLSDALKGVNGLGDNLSVRDLDKFVSRAIPESSPSLKSMGSDLASSVATGAIGGAGGYLLNAATGANVDPMTAIIAGGAYGARSPASNLAQKAATKVSQKISLNPVVKRFEEEGASKLLGAVNQIGGQASTRDVLSTTDVKSSPFGKLTDFLSMAENTENPSVQAAAESAQSNVDESDPDSRRKAAMALQATPEGRAVGNSDSPVNQKDEEDLSQYKRK